MLKNISKFKIFFLNLFLVLIFFYLLFFALDIYFSSLKFGFNFKYFAYSSLVSLIIYLLIRIKK